MDLKVIEKDLSVKILNNNELEVTLPAMSVSQITVEL